MDDLCLPSGEYIQNPRDVKEILATGAMPTLGDRYSGLMKEPQVCCQGNLRHVILAYHVAGILG